MKDKKKRRKPDKRLQNTTAKKNEINISYEEESRATREMITKHNGKALSTIKKKKKTDAKGNTSNKLEKKGQQQKEKEENKRKQQKSSEAQNHWKTLPLMRAFQIMCIIFFSISFRSFA